MSGSTVVVQGGKHYLLTVSTPNMNFAMNPDGSSPEQGYHAAARARFQADLAPLGGLDPELEALAAQQGLQLVPLSDELPVVHVRVEWSVKSFREKRQRPCRCEWPLGAPEGSQLPPLDHATMAIGFARLPEPAELDRFAATLARRIDAIRAHHHREQAEAERRGAVHDAPFHYLVGPGGIEDLNGDADGSPPPAAAPARAGLELCAALSALVAAAEADGVVHAELGPDCVRVGASGVSLQGFGQTRPRGDPPAPEGRSDFYVDTVRAPDWQLRQRWGLGRVCRELVGEHAGARALTAALMAPRPAHRPTPAEARRRFSEFAAAAAGADLTAWLATPATPALDLDRRRPAQMAARRAAGARGLLEPCAVCGRPALRGSSRDLPGPTGYRPDCCWRARQRRYVRLVMLGLVAAALAGVALLVRHCA